MSGRKRTIPKKYLEGESPWTAGRQDSAAGKMRTRAGGSRHPVQGVLAAAATAATSHAIARPIQISSPVPRSLSPVSSISAFSAVGSHYSPTSPTDSPMADPRFHSLPSELPAMSVDGADRAAADQRAGRSFRNSSSFLPPNVPAVEVDAVRNQQGVRARSQPPPCGGYSRRPSSFLPHADMHMPSPSACFEETEHGPMASGYSEATRHGEESSQQGLRTWSNRGPAEEE